MGLLKQLTTHRVVPLGHRILVGRSSGSDLRIENRKVSAEHAMILWSGRAWQLKDLASKNGTVVDGSRIVPGPRVPLRSGSTIHFGEPGERWLLSSAAPPGIVGIGIDTPHVIEGEFDYLPLDDETTVLTEDGTDFWIEQGGVRRLVHDGEVVSTTKGPFKLSIPPLQREGSTTLTEDRALLFSELKLVFEVSRDEEHVQLVLRSPEEEHRFRARSFDSMLLALARARLTDARDGSLKPSEHGWVYVDELAASLDLDISHLNVDIYRARKRLAEAGVDGAEQLIERRTSTHAVRLGTALVEIA